MFRSYGHKKKLKMGMMSSWKKLTASITIFLWVRLK